MRIDLLIIDPQNDFMDEPGAALAVPGAAGDMKRTATMVERVGSKLSDIHVTLDSHHPLHVAHSAMWLKKDGNHPDPFTPVSSQDIATGILRPIEADAKPPELDGLTIGEFMLVYARELEEPGRIPLMIWPTHCLIGNPGHNIQEDLAVMLNRWATAYHATIGFYTKGDTVYVEKYGAFMAEKVLPNVASTGLNTALLDQIMEADEVGTAGEALSHCFMASVNQIVEYVGDKHGQQFIQKFVLLEDASSPVPQVGDGPNFPEIADEWKHKMVQMGMRVSTTDKWLA